MFENVNGAFCNFSAFNCSDFDYRRSVRNSLDVSVFVNRCNLFVAAAPFNAAVFRIGGKYGCFELFGCALIKRESF